MRQDWKDFVFFNKKPVPDRFNQRNHINGVQQMEDCQRILLCQKFKSTQRIIESAIQNSQNQHTNLVRPLDGANLRSSMLMNIASFIVDNNLNQKWYTLWIFQSRFCMNGKHGITSADEERARVIFLNPADEQQTSSGKLTPPAVLNQKCVDTKNCQYIFPLLRQTTDMYNNLLQNDEHKKCDCDIMILFTPSKHRIEALMRCMSEKDESDQCY